MPRENLSIDEQLRRLKKALSEHQRLNFQGDDKDEYLFALGEWAFGEMRNDEDALERQRKKLEKNASKLPMWETPQQWSKRNYGFDHYSKKKN